MNVVFLEVIQTEIQTNMKHNEKLARFEKKHEIRYVIYLKRVMISTFFFLESTSFVARFVSYSRLIRTIVFCFSIWNRVCFCSCSFRNSTKSFVSMRISLTTKNSRLYFFVFCLSRWMILSNYIKSLRFDESQCVHLSK